MASLPFPVIPVVDLKNGQAVHAIAGRRDHYQPIRSILHAGSDPIALARALRDRLGLRALYLADLDAIAGEPIDRAVYEGIIALGIHLVVDPGMRDVDSAAPLLELGGSDLTMVAGLETLRGPHELGAILNRAGAERVIFSLDLFDGRGRVASQAEWAADDPAGLAGEAIAQGACQLLVLDLARVGTGMGPGTDDLMASIHEAHPTVRLSVGGGISGIDEVITLRNAGAANVLLGSALHDGRIGARELAELLPKQPDGSAR
jgi:phosphoribosylformimino-5-aminoimidazole carboxamide ribotide isomerase